MNAKRRRADHPEDRTFDMGMKKRFLFFMGINGFIILVWAVYLFTVQILDPYGFEQNRRVRYTPAKELHIPTRGNIYDRNRELLARSVRFYQIDYDRSVLCSDDRDSDYRQLAGIISRNTQLTESYVLNRLRNAAGDSGVYLSDRIRETDLISLNRELAESNFQRGLITGFSFQRRVYPAEKTAARLLGIVRESRDVESRSKLSYLEGLSGVEHTFDNYLQGVYGWRKLLYDARRNPLVIPSLARQQVRDGSHIVLTLDSRIQEIVEMNLREGLEQYGAKNAIAIFMNPKTGEISAMAGISENDRKLNAQELRGLPNLAVSFMFEPGSTIKPFTALAALEKNLFATNDTLDCRTYRLPGRTIRDSHEFEDLSFRDVMVKSSNVGTSKIAEEIGAQYLYERLISLGFGNRTGSELYGESAGLFRHIRDWQGFSLHSVSFGQEMAVTPLQLVTAYSAIANGGTMMRPYIMKEILDINNNLIKENKPSRIRTTSNPAAIDTLHTILRDVVEYGTGTNTRLPYISIAGKTGTAEKQGDTAGYARGKYIANFAGYFPVEDPQLVGVVIYDEPSYYYRYASISAVVTFRKIVEQILALPDCNILTSTRQRETTFAAVPDLIGKSLDEADQKLHNSGIGYQIIGKTDISENRYLVVNQYPKKGIELDTGNKVTLVVEKEAIDGSGNRAAVRQALQDTPSLQVEQIMPDLTGLTVREALRQARRNNIRLKVHGSGQIQTQSIPPGKSVGYGKKCIVTAG